MTRHTPSFTARVQRGFTLVEIAIVLLIVGLLLGGVLKGQELISSAKVSNLAQSMNGYQAAVLGFQDRYRFLPGDSSQAAARVGSGAVNCVGGNCNNGQINPWGETSLVNNHLSAAGFYKGPALNVLTNAAPTANGYQTNSAGGAMFVSYWNQFPNNTGARGTLNRNGVYTGGNLNSRLLAEYDRKADDGNAWTGSVREAWPGNAACSPGGNWLEDNARDDCAAVTLY